jgi:hypothetical protein
MRLKKQNHGVRVCALVSLLVLAATALTSAPALALPEGRVYEMISPVYKQGYGAEEIKAVQPQGESVAFGSQGGFAGALSGGSLAAHDYLARRGASGWSTVSFEPAFGALTDVSANLEYALASGPLGPNAGFENYAKTEEVFQLHRSGAPDTAESWEVFGGIVLKRLDEKQLLAVEEGASPDLCHVLVGRAEGALLPAAENATFLTQLYDLSRGCGGGSPSLRLVGVHNDEASTPINRHCTVELGSGFDYVKATATRLEQESAVNAIDEHGDEIFFTANVEEAPFNCFAEGDHQLFVRLGGARTVEVSRPLGGCVGKGVVGEVPCDGAATRASAYFKGASQDGSRVFFTTSAPLVSGDHDTGNDLYMATIGCPGVEPSEAQSCEPSRREVTSLVQVSQGLVANQPADVQSVVRLAPDGSRAYFVARGVLTSEGPTGEGVQSQPVKDADNLYVSEPDPEHAGRFKTVFIAELCSGPARSGEAEDVRCPRELTEGGGADVELLWGHRQSEAQSTVDGAFLVFDSFGQLVSGDTDNAKDVYRYDAQTGVLERVSVGENSYDANGNGVFDANIHAGSMGTANGWVSLEREMGGRAISEDGSRIVFDTVEPLSPDAKNHKTNIYEWHEGSLSLISSGTAEEGDKSATITASGRDIMFTTSQGLVAQDTDGLPDIYDARLGGGFPPMPAERQPCSGDACQGPLTNPAPLLVPGSTVQAPGGNFAAPASKPVVKAKKKTKAKKKVKKKGRAFRRSGKASKAAAGRNG